MQRAEIDISRFQVRKRRKGDPRSERDAALLEVMSFVGWDMNDKRRLGQMLRKLKGKTPSRVLDLKKKAINEGKKPAGLFLWLLDNE